MFLVDQPDLKTAVCIARGVDIKYAPIQYEIWAPKWVSNAYAVWKSGDKSYGDLTLAGLLEVMNPVDTQSESK